MTLLTARSSGTILRAHLADAYRSARILTLKLCQPLSSEDMVVQVEPFASPTKWHLAHTTWFFETFALKPYERRFAWHDEAFPFLFNSYYHTLGRMHARNRRGLITRPTLEETLVYRHEIDDRMMSLIHTGDDATLIELQPIIELGLNHEQQHQELMLTDIKLLLAANPMDVAYRQGNGSPTPNAQGPGPLAWIPFEGGVVEIGHDTESHEFAYDNEGPRHRRFLEPFELADRLVTNGEFREFIEAGGYTRPQHWLDDGWSRVSADQWSHPLYWRQRGSEWQEYTLSGWKTLDAAAPACHISFFEADAFARWSGARLPTEAEWEHAAECVSVVGNFLESDRLHPLPSATGGEGAALRQMFGDAWQWTRSAHEPYPGYAPPEGAIGEYNGKFMNNCYVLRGGSCVTSRSHVRRTYRNFFEPGARWQFTGFRLARCA